ncbi:DUF4382 domain-containing protein [Saccharicrinis sp. FJH2]|uniref:DUF4382 domain-containing protein n=1 Tax=Saccharicrinis sp. FJH65 TaxID=3344659 RepID=UPI0035F4B417
MNFKPENILKRIISLALIFVSAGIIFTSCDENQEGTTSSTSTLRVKLTDSPGDYKAVYVDIQEVKIYSVTEEDSGWVSLPNIHTGMYDLLKLTNGVDTLLGENEIKSGMISQIRLILGENNYLVTEDDSVKLSTPSAQQSGLKIKVNRVLDPDLSYDILLDFDASRSVVKAGNSGKYNLKPVIRTVVEQSTGTIKGMVSADSVSCAVYAITGEDSVGTFTDTTGMFLLKGLDPDTYALYIDPGENSGLKDTSISNITVTSGNVTDLGMITIAPAD